MLEPCARALCWSNLLEHYAQGLCLSIILKDNAGALSSGTMLEHYAGALCWSTMLEHYAGALCWSTMLKDYDEPQCWSNRYAGDDVVNKFKNRLATLWWNKALWLDAASFKTSFIQLECFIWEQICYAMLNMTSDSEFEHSDWWLKMFQPIERLKTSIW